MISMNIRDQTECAPSSDCSPTIYLNNEQCEALGITKMPEPGTVYTLAARAVAVRVTAEAEDPSEVAVEGNAPDISLTLQLCEIEIAAPAGKNAASMLYGE